MSEAPKILWVEYEEGCWPTVMEKKYEAGTKYIRADIVEEMREALEQCLRINGYQNAREMITAALKLLEEV